MNSFTGIVLRQLLRDPETPDTVRQWIRSERDPERRAVDFAVQLGTDFEAMAKSFTDPLLKDWLSLAASHVNWRRVAEKLLERFSPWAPRSVPAPSRN